MAGLISTTPSSAGARRPAAGRMARRAPAAILFVLEEETEPKRFSIHRLAHYCLDLAELYKIERAVPVVIFLHPGHYAETLNVNHKR